MVIYLNIIWGHFGRSRWIHLPNICDGTLDGHILIDVTLCRYIANIYLDFFLVDVEDLCLTQRMCLQVATFAQRIPPVYVQFANHQRFGFSLNIFECDFEQVLLDFWGLDQTKLVVAYSNKRRISSWITNQFSF